MPTLIVNLLADSPGTKYGWYRFQFSVGADAYITKITNQSIGTLWFPRQGATQIDFYDPSTFVKLDPLNIPSNWMSPDDLQGVYGFSAPHCPVEIVAIAAVPDSKPSDPDPEGFPDPIGVPDTNTEHDDVGDPSPGPALPYIQIEVEYVLALPVMFNPVIHVISASDRRQDGCGKTFYGVGSSLTLGVLIGSFSGGPISSTNYDWHLSGAQITAGAVDEVTAVPTITIELDQPGTVHVSVDVVIDTSITGGSQPVPQSTSRTATFGCSVLTDEQAALAQRICRLLSSVLPIRQFVFPGDPAKRPDMGDVLEAAELAREHAGDLVELVGEIRRFES
jgi:hypothetical protein